MGKSSNRRHSSTSQKVEIGGTKHLDQYSKLWNRFYEPLILLRVLGQTRGDHSPRLQEQPLYRVLNNLSYLCDYDKGGSTTTAIGLEDDPAKYKFWVASNDAKKAAANAKFLKYALSDVKAIITVAERSRTEAAERFICRCLGHAKKRIEKEVKLLRREIQNCIVQKPGDTELALLLQSFSRGESSDLCRHAYHIRHKTLPKTAETEYADSSDNVTRQDPSSGLNAVRHYLGRLAHHIRAPEQILADFSNFSQLRNVIDEFEVCVVPGVVCVKRPQYVQACIQTNPSRSQIISQNHKPADIFSMLNRMLPSGLSNSHDYRTALEVMERKYHIQDGVSRQYEDDNFKPLVHAEIQVLDYFYSAKRRYFDDARYIGCSKPSCYCCHLYILHHPARCVEPQTSKKLYLNWGLRALSGADDPLYLQQRDILNKMVITIREDALDQVIRKAEPIRWHADSQTGITQGMDVECAEDQERLSKDDTLCHHSGDDGGSEDETSVYSDLLLNPATSSTTQIQLANPPATTYFMEDEDSDSDGGAPL
ncbi:hypothetical protein F4801DRAFT_172088 [Xylaria longipes]|nr:hypothetical protein F4801DRAFT_172088 [Xylaria longipes]RYC56725.1 hypothetical protein CHU98_g9490 [Xylaria longipes]